jgi:two-component system sensor histidine kinase DegS
MTDDTKKSSFAQSNVMTQTSSDTEKSSPSSSNQTSVQQLSQTDEAPQNKDERKGTPVSVKELEEDTKKVLSLLWSFKEVLIEFQMDLRKQTGQSIKELEGQFKDLIRRIEAFHENLCLKKTLAEKIQSVKDINQGLANAIDDIGNEAHEDQARVMVSDKFNTILNTYSDIIEKVSLLESNFETLFRTQKTVQERKELQRASAALPGTSAIIRSQELERQRIAREIHDGPAQAIANVIFRLDIIHKMMAQKPDAVPEEMTKVKEIAQGALNEIRHFIFDLRPMTLQDLGLTATLKKIIQHNPSMSETKVELLIEGEEHVLDPDIDLAIFRIAQESLSNIKKHAHADHAWVHLKYLPDKVILIVEDDGCGFDLKGKRDKPTDEYSSFGLLGMQERADDANGTLQITSQPMRGTKIIFTVPLN